MLRTRLRLLIPMACAVTPLVGCAGGWRQIDHCGDWVDQCSLAGVGNWFDGPATSSPASTTSVAPPDPSLPGPALHAEEFAAPADAPQLATSAKTAPAASAVAPKPRAVCSPAVCPSDGPRTMAARPWIERPAPGPPPVRFRPETPPPFLPVPTRPTISPATASCYDPAYAATEWGFKPHPEIRFPGG